MPDMLRRLDKKAGGQRPGIAGAVIDGAAAGVDTAEIVGVARKDGTAPRIGRRAGGVVPIMYLAVSGPVIVILGLVILLRAVGVGPGPVVFKLRKQRQQIRGAGDIAGGVTSAEPVTPDGTAD